VPQQHQGLIGRDALIRKDLVGDGVERLSVFEL
jgi:hypothetical protein